MANSAEFENKMEFKTCAELTDRITQLEQAATQSRRRAVQSAKRKQSAIKLCLQDAMHALQLQEQQLEARSASITEREAALLSSQELLSKLERRLEIQLERLARIPRNAQSTPQNEGSDQQLTLLEERVLQAEYENRLLHSDLAEVREELGLYRQVFEEQSSLALQGDERLEQLRTELGDARLQIFNSSVSDAACKELADEAAGLRQRLLEAEEFARMLQEELLAGTSASTSGPSKLETSEQSLIVELQAEVASLQTTLMAIRTDSHSNRAQQENASTSEISDLKQQNADLAAKLARLQLAGYNNGPHLNLCQESMSWEERKQLILQQLEDEGSEMESPGQGKKRLEIAEVLALTQAEIDRRDREIQEMQAIIEQQSNTQAGVAIGAAAIAQMLDGDELLKQERERLKAIQKDWENKLRQAEIDMSLERAKLGRERAQFEAQLQDKLADAFSTLPIVVVNGECEAGKSDKKVVLKSTEKPARKWLEHLGLKDN